MNVTILRDDFQNDQIHRAVRLHAEADTRANSLEFRLTPSQACLVWWGMRLLNRAIRDSSRWCDDGAEFADSLRCHADAVEWSKAFMNQLDGHAKDHNLEVMRCR